MQIGLNTCDPTESLAATASLQNPAGWRAPSVRQGGLRAGSCAAIQVGLDLARGRSARSSSSSASREHRAATTPTGWCSLPRGRRRAAALEAVWQYWSHTLGAVQVETPTSRSSADNGCFFTRPSMSPVGAQRVYQSGGAFGFRDQLQDAMALVHAEPRLLRAHLLLCAGRQFREGDVRLVASAVRSGVRTIVPTITLVALATCATVDTGDTGVLDEPVPFLEAGRSMTTIPTLICPVDRKAPRVCIALRARHPARTHVRIHGLPLIGSGDWNDGIEPGRHPGQGGKRVAGIFPV